jgi:hypothetical protein
LLCGSDFLKNTLEALRGDSGTGQSAGFCLALSLPGTHTSLPWLPCLGPEGRSNAEALPVQTRPLHAARGNSHISVSLCGTCPTLRNKGLVQASGRDGWLRSSWELSPSRLVPLVWMENLPWLQCRDHHQ